MRSKIRRTGYMAIKVDLEKACDRLNWNFIQDTLVDMGLPNEVIEVMRECISSARMSLL